MIVAHLAASSAARAAAPRPGATLPQIVLPGLSLSWNDCAGGATGMQNLGHACGSDTDTLELYCALAVSQNIGNVIGAEVVVDIQHASGMLPDWWRLTGGGAAGCRAGALSTSYDFALSGGCTDAWQTLGFGSIQNFTIGPPDHQFVSQARIKAVASVTSDHAVSLAPGIEYGLVKLRIATNRTTGASACAGCGEAACLVFQSVILRVIPGSGSDVQFGDPAAPSADFATYQGSGADCFAVPVRHSSWGVLKALYR